MKVVLFDVDGVLLDSTYVNFTEFGISPEQTQPFYRGPFQQALIGTVDTKIIVEPFLKEWNFPGTTDDFLNYWHEFENTPRANMLALAQTIRALGIKAGIATNQDYYRTEFLKNKLRFNTLFDYFYASCEVGVTKYDSAFFTKVLNDLAVQPSDMLFFDDTQKCIDSAKSVGISAYLYTNYDQCLQDLHRHIQL